MRLRADLECRFDTSADADLRRLRTTRFWVMRSKMGGLRRSASMPSRRIEAPARPQRSHVSYVIRSGVGATMCSTLPLATS